jgi:hypothetical protein
LRSGIPTRSWAHPAAVATVTIAAIGYLALVDPNQPGHYPVCPFHAVTGLWCPGCGGLRAMHALAHGDLAAAIGFNVVAVALVPVAGYAGLRWMARRLGRKPRPVRLPQPALWTLGAVVLIFGIVRNLPFGAAFAP